MSVRAEIVFDQNKAIATGEWLNTVDRDRPASRVRPLAATQPIACFPEGQADRAVRTSGGCVSQLVPGVPALARYRREWLRGDVMAGLTVAAYLVPQVLAYAGLALIMMTSRLAKLTGVPVSGDLFLAEVSSFAGLS